jgi:hypothetical protein
MSPRHPEMNATPVRLAANVEIGPATALLFEAIRQAGRDYDVTPDGERFLRRRRVVRRSRTRTRSP